MTYYLNKASDKGKNLTCSFGRKRTVLSVKREKDKPGSYCAADLNLSFCTCEKQALYDAAH